jgi:hypothetical protein
VPVVDVRVEPGVVRERATTLAAQDRSVRSASAADPDLAPSLLAAVFKRDPEVSDEFAEWLGSFRSQVA